MLQSDSFLRGEILECHGRFDRTMAAFGLLFVSLFLASCSFPSASKAPSFSDVQKLAASGSAVVDQLRHQAADAVTVGKSAISEAESTVDDLSARAAKVQQGVSKIQEGRKLIEEGVTK